jgi:hypothetical protein
MVTSPFLMEASASRERKLMRANALSVMSYLDDFYEDEESN